jgi:hypothetical protein
LNNHLNSRTHAKCCEKKVKEEEEVFNLDDSKKRKRDDNIDNGYESQDLDEYDSNKKIKNK